LSRITEKYGSILESLENEKVIEYTETELKVNEIKKQELQRKKVLQRFPHNDPPLKVLRGTLAQTSYVASNRPFKDVKIPVRDTIGVEMEGASFYEALSNYPNDFWRLVVKAVCDYADMEKDDSFHEYASQISAAFIFGFIKEYVNSKFPTRLAIPESLHLSSTRNAQMGEYSHNQIKANSLYQTSIPDNACVNVLIKEKKKNSPQE